MQMNQTKIWIQKSGSKNLGKKCSYRKYYVSSETWFVIMYLNGVYLCIFLKWILWHSSPQYSANLQFPHFLKLWKVLFSSFNWSVSFLHSKQKCLSLLLIGNGMFRHNVVPNSTHVLSLKANFNLNSSNRKMVSTFQDGVTDPNWTVGLKSQQLIAELRSLIS